MIAKVTNVQANGTFTTKQNNLLYKFDYEFSDGIALQANHVDPTNAFKVGDEVEYVITKDDPKWGKSGKVTKPQLNPIQPNNNFINQAKTPEEKTAIQKAIIYQSAFKEAVGFHNMAGFKGSSAQSSLEELCSTADYIAKYVIEKSGI